jgi:hypothetical protein
MENKGKNIITKRRKPAAVTMTYDEYQRFRRLEGREMGTEMEDGKEKGM